MTTDTHSHLLLHDATVRHHLLVTARPVVRRRRRAARALLPTGRTA